MVLAGSSCLWSEVVGLRAGSNASGCPHPWWRRERELLLLLLEAFTAPHSHRRSPAKHMTSPLCLRLHMCVFAWQRDTESKEKKKWVIEPRERERKGIYRQCFADRDVLYFTEEWREKSLEGKPTPHAPWRFLNPSPQATSGPPSPLSLHLYLLISLSHKSAPSILSGTLLFLGFICSSIMSLRPTSIQFDAI